MAQRRAFKIGDVLGGKYRIERIVGEGGMGIVVAAQHVELRQRVAIKLLQGTALDDAEQVARFLREARAAVQLRSEHAARVLDVGRTKNRAPFMVMELLEGQDLGVTLSQGPLPVPTAIDYVLQACEAIAEAHALGIVHRDLKPRNLFLTRRVNGEALVKVLDFGLAKQEGDSSMTDKGLTRTTAVMGSPQYMSPEQMVASRDVDARTDLWSLGVCLYELLSNQLPFDAPTMPGVCALVMTSEPRPLPALCPEVPEALWEIVRRCLAKDPAERIGSVLELATLLEPFGSPASQGAVIRVATAARTATRAPIVHPPAIMHDSDTRTEAAFDSGADRSSGVTWMLVVAGVAIVLLVGGAAAYGVRRGHASRAAEAATELPPASTASAVPELAATSTSANASANLGDLDDAGAGAGASSTSAARPAGKSRVPAAPVPPKKPAGDAKGPGHSRPESQKF